MHIEALKARQQMQLPLWLKPGRSLRSPASVAVNPFSSSSSSNSNNNKIRVRPVEVLLSGVRQHR